MLPRFLLLAVVMSISHQAEAVPMTNTSINLKPTSTLTQAVSETVLATEPIAAVTARNETPTSVSGLRMSSIAVSTSPNHTVSSTTVFPSPTSGFMKDGASWRTYIIIGIAVVVLLIIVTVFLVALKSYRKASKYQARNSFPMGGPYPEAAPHTMSASFEHRVSVRNMKNLSSPLSDESLNLGGSIQEWPDIRYHPPCKAETSLSRGSHRSRGTNPQTVDGAAFYNHVAEEADDYPTPTSEKQYQFFLPPMAKEVITVDGGILKTDCATLEVLPGCLSKDTKITMIPHHHYFPFKQLFDSELLDVPAVVIEFLPDGLKFESAVDLTVRLPNDDSSLELFVLHGSHDSKEERVNWQVVNDDVLVKREEQNVYTKIHGFCFYSYILSRRGRLARILSHLNHSFNCYAVGLYRRISSSHIDIAVGFLSEFVDESASQINMMVDENRYNKSEKGCLKRINPRRRLEVCLDFPGLTASEPCQVTLEVSQLDGAGMVLDNFREISQEFPAKGKIHIYKIKRGLRKLLWTLYIDEDSPKDRKIVGEVVVKEKDPGFSQEGSEANLDLFPDVIRRTGRLTSSEISRLSRCVGMDWESLAGLLDIPYNEREQIRNESDKCPPKAKRIISLFNEGKHFSRKLFLKYLEEIGRNDLVRIILPSPEQDKESENDDEHQGNQVVDDVGPPSDEPIPDDPVVRRDTPLSPREMYRLSRRIVDFDSLAGLMDISRPIVDNIRNNQAYPDPVSKTERVLDIFNNGPNFCRNKLARFLDEMGRNDLVEKVKEGSLRCS